ncbi:MAG: hypothetical protein A2W03_05070 [Candidatus Aminicenantes bacterium RBG_16_63_16]|nr:MAG: hypothetical protein A2W03_05070 [Candidatus Aminicenantes bacterium RBG_16_63_16]
MSRKAMMSFCPSDRPYRALRGSALVVFVCFSLLYLGAAPLHSSDPLPDSSVSSTLLKPLKTTQPPVIDGRLDDAVWAAAPSVTGFKTFIPDFGRDISEETFAYMAYDSANLYFAFECLDREPDKIKATLSRRDDIRTDDMVCINLDSFNDQQSLYALYVNPLGIQMDSRYASNKEDYSVDLVWYCAGRLHDRGYSIELQVPLKSIRYSSGDRVEMGIFFERVISRRTEHGSYPPLDPAKGYAFLTEMAPIEYSGLREYTLLELLPAFTYHRSYAQSQGRLVREDSQPDLSLTGKYGLTPSLILDGAYNPDFSQVEADAGQVDVNLRYDLYFPEKRPFFLEGSEIFNLAGISDYSYPTEAVHTRDIVDPQAGFKLSGKLGKRDTVAAIFAADETLPINAPSAPLADHAYFSIARYRRAIRGDGYLGAFFTDREWGGRFNRVAGPDGQVRLSKATLLSFHALGSSTSDDGGAPARNGLAAGLDILYDTRNLRADIVFQDISRDFENESGYLTRTGFLMAGFSVSPFFYPKSEILKRIAPTLASLQLRDEASGLWETFESLTLNFTLVRTSRISLGAVYSTEVYRGQKFETSGWIALASSQITKELFFRVLFRDEKAIRYSVEPYQGHGKRAVASLIYQPSEKINWSLDLTYADFFREAGSEKIYDYTIVRNRLIYQLNKYLFFRGIVEYNAFRRELLTDFLASFTYIPGTVIHLGYGSLYEKTRWEDGVYVPGRDLLETRRGFFFKASYLWRL